MVKECQRQNTLEHMLINCLQYLLGTCTVKNGNFRRGAKLNMHKRAVLKCTNDPQTFCKEWKNNVSYQILLVGELVVLFWYINQISQVVQPPLWTYQQSILNGSCEPRTFCEWMVTQLSTAFSKVFCCSSCWPPGHPSCPDLPGSSRIFLPSSARDNRRLAPVQPRRRLQRSFHFPTAQRHTRRPPDKDTVRTWQ